MDQSHKYSKGQLLVELIMAFALAAIILPAVTTGFVATRQGKAQERQRLEAAALARQIDEAVRVVRDESWTLVATNGVYHATPSGTTWSLVSGPITVNDYTQSAEISDVVRNGSVDPSIKLVTVRVSWGTPIPSEVEHEFYLTRLSNLSWVQTTQPEFDLGIKTDVVTTNIINGEVTLGAGGRADWCSPDLTIAAVNLPKNGVANAVSAIEGQLFAGTGENASGVSYATVTIDNNNPPGATVSGTFNGFKTNDIAGEENYAYIATDNNAKEIEIINLLTNPYSEAGYYNAPGNGNGDTVFVVGNVGYMTTGTNFYTFDLSSKTGNRSTLGTVALAGVGVKMYVIGNYAYIAENSATTQLQIINVTNPALPTVIGQAQVNGLAGKDVFVNQTGTRAYLATAVSATQRELFILDVTTKTGNHNTPIGSYDTSGMNPNGITVVPGNRALLVGTGAEEYQAIDIFNESAPFRCGGLSIDSGVNGISSVLEADGDAYSYIITGDATTELKIIEGGPGGKFASEGIFESSTLDASVSSAFNRFIPNAIIPAGTLVEYQVSGADAVNDSCDGAVFSFVGPDGTTNTKFATGSAIPLSVSGSYKNPARCFRYRAYLTALDPLFAPLFTDMTVNYSP